MKDFMTKISDYLNERRNDPERRESQLSVVIIGAVAVVIIVLLLLLLWSYTVRERRQKQEEDELEAAFEEDDTLIVETFEEKAEEYMAQNDGQELLRQEYLENIDHLSEKVEELLNSMTQVEKNLSETIIQYQEGDQDRKSVV